MKYIKTLSTYPTTNKIFHILKEQEESVFLDSSTQGELGQFSIIACRPYLKLVKRNDSFTINGEPCHEDFSKYVKTYLQTHYEENDTDLPIISGAIGYFSYDYGREKEKVITQHTQTLDIPESILYFYDIFVVEDHRNQTLHIIANNHTQDAKKAVDQIQGYIQNHITSGFEPDSKLDSESVFEIEIPTDFNCTSKVIANYTAEEYMEAVNHMIQYIVDGDIYVVNMTQQLEIESDCDPYAMFCNLRKTNPSPFGGYLDYGDFQIVCASPERFMRLQNGKIKTRPIKGTRKRGATPEEDQMLKEELANSKKDQSELLMIVDLERNDLNRVCIPGTVQVTELFKVETYATVFHLVANVEGQIREGCNAIDLMEAAFPGGSITGAPKLRAMELIDQEEHRLRNLYTGSIGYIALNGDCDLNIVIRTAVHKDGIYHLGVGGGITCESELEFEYEETWQKAKALLDTLQVKKSDSKIGEVNYEYTVR